MREARDSVVILSAGFSGSSILTGLLANAGYWPGDETAKVAYETYENTELIELNRYILGLADFSWEESDRPYPDLAEIKKARQHVDVERLKAFVTKCETRSPFIWKDPRIVYTMEIWAELVDLARVKFIIVEREIKQIFTGQILRSHTYHSIPRLTDVMSHSLRTAVEFCASRMIQPLRVSFEDLIARPERSLEQIGGFLGLSLGVADLRAVYADDLGRVKWTEWDYRKARLQAITMKLRMLLGI